MKTTINKPTSNNIRRKVLKDQTLPSPLKNSTIKVRLEEKDFEDLIEIKRQRDKTQNERSTLFFLIGLCIALGSLIILFNWKFYQEEQITDLGNLDKSTFEEIHEIPPTEQPPPPPPAAIQAPRIVEVSDEVIIEEVEIDIDVEVTEEMVVEEVEFAPIEEEVAEEIFEIVENQPVPVGGYGAFYKFVGDNLRYPKNALKMGIGGRVFVKFVVDKDGSITEVEVVKGIGGGCDEEAMRVVEMAPNWNPGKQRGRAVKVYMTIPITFRLVK